MFSLRSFSGALRAVLDFLLFSNLFIALCAVAQGMVTYHLLGIEPNRSVLGVLFLGTLVIYNLSMLLSRPRDAANSPFKRVKWIFSHPRLLTTITLVACLALIPLGLFFLSFQGKILMLGTGLIAASYSFPFLSLNGKPVGLRNLPGVKLFLIAFVWSVSTVAFPIIEAEANMRIDIVFNELILLTLKRFLFIAAITIPFDIRDLFQDKLYELRTLPVMLGERKAHWICFGMLVACAVLLVAFSGTIDMKIISLLLTLGITAWLIFRSGIKKNEYFYFLFLDGMMIVQWALLTLITALQLNQAA